MSLPDERPSPETTRVREGDVVGTLVRLADTVVGDYDLVELLGDLVRSSVRVLGADHAGLSLADGGELRFVAASSEVMEAIEAHQIAHGEGPCVEAFATGQQVSSPEIEADRSTWPAWAPRALELGFRAAHAFPLRLRDETIGVLNVYSSIPGPLSERDIVVGTGFADMATIGIVHQRDHSAGEEVRDQLERALSSRVVIEQAKGVISGRDQVATDVAFDRIRRHARSHRCKLAEVARQVVDGTLSLS